MGRGESLWGWSGPPKSSASSASGELGQTTGAGGVAGGKFRRCEQAGPWHGLPSGAAACGAGIPGLPESSDAGTSLPLASRMNT
jgi:hypothetical protein